MKIKKGDTILVVRGKDKRKKAKVLRGFPQKAKLLLEGVNIKKAHRRGRREGEKGQVVELPSPIDIAKVKLICPKCSKPTRVGYQLSQGKKKRVCKKCHQEI